MFVRALVFECCDLVTERKTLDEESRYHVQLANVKHLTVDCGEIGKISVSQGSAHGDVCAEHLCFVFECVTV